MIRATAPLMFTKSPLRLAANGQSMWGCRVKRRGGSAPRPDRLRRRGRRRRCHFTQPTASNRLRPTTVIDTTRGGVGRVVFAVLFGVTLILIRTNMPEGTDNSIYWLSKGQGGIATTTVLMPFAGISFLWFIGVVAVERTEA